MANIVSGFGAASVNGTADADIILGQEGIDTGVDTINGGSGNDVIVGDIDLITNDTGAGNGTFATAINIDNSAGWSTQSNPLVADDTVPYTTILGEGAGEFDVFEVTVGIGATLTADIDFGSDVFGGPTFDSELRFFDSTETQLDTNDDSIASNGGLGSTSGFGTPTGTDSFLQWTNNTGSEQTVYIRVEQFNDAVIGAGNTYLLGVSVTGHANSNVAIQGADSINGDAGNDFILGNDGDDTLNGGADNDTIYGGKGDDFIDGGSENDTVFGGEGNDTFNGDIGDDSLEGGDGNDLFFAATGVDTMRGGSGTDIMNLFSSEDSAGQVFDGGADFDTLSVVAFGGVGTVNLRDDTVMAIERLVFFDNNAGPTFMVEDIQLNASQFADFTTVLASDHAGQTVQLSLFMDTETSLDLSGLNVTGFIETGDKIAVTGDADAETITGSGINDSISGNGGDDSLLGNAGNDTLDGGADNDTLNGGAGFDVLRGGAGDDVIIYLAGEGIDDINGGTETDLFDASAATENMRVDIADGTHEYDNSGAERNFLNMENITTGAGDDTVTGNELANQLAGGGGNDSIEGGGGNDIIAGGTGNDTLRGGAGTDTVLGGDNDDLIQVFIGEFTTNDFLDGGDGTDTFFLDAFFTGTNGTFNMTTGDFSTVSGAVVNFENFDGSQDGASISVIGTTGNNNIMTGSNTDTLDGGQGDDTLSGGAGNDTLIGGDGNDTLNGGDDTDTADYSGVGGGGSINLTAGTASFATGNDTLISIENVITGGANETITDNNQNNNIQAGGGNDTVIALNNNAGDDFDGGAGTRDRLVMDLTWSSGVLFNMVAGEIQFSGGTRASFTGFEDLTLGGNAAVAGSDVANNILFTTTSGSGGTGTDNLVLAAGGNDTVDGGIGNDSLDGGQGDDDLRGGSGIDTIAGGIGADTLDGGDDIDTVDYSAETTGGIINLVGADGIFASGIDELFRFENVIGSGFADMITGGNENNLLQGGGGNDTLIGGIGDDTLDGGADTDTADYSNETAGGTINLLTGSANFASGNDTLISIENVTGSGFDDTIFDINGQANGIDAGAGNDTVIASDVTFDVTYDGGAGTRDQLAMGLGWTEIVTFNMATGRVEIDGGADFDLFFTNFEDFLVGGNADVIGSDVANNIQFSNAVGSGGTGNDNSVSAAGGNDTVDGGLGNDSINGEAGLDSLIGGDGDDTLIGGADNDTLDGGADTDTADYSGEAAGGTINLLSGSAVFASGNDTLISIENVVGSGFVDTINGDTLDNDLSGGAGLDTISGSGGNDTIDGGTGGDRLLGGAGNDELTGGVGNDLLAGNDDNDMLDGGASQDTLIGGNGDDTLEGGFGDDTLDGGAGTDTAIYSGFGGGITVNLNITTSQNTGAAGNDELAFIENIIGGDFNDRFTGRTGETVIDAGNGSDFVFGLGGNDTLDGGAGNDNVIGGNGNDLLTGGTGRDAILGGGDNDTLFGGAENDQLRGGDGADRLQGGAGRDVLIGGDFVAGGFPGDGDADIFIFTDVSESGPGGASRDIIRDYDAGIDIIDLSQIDAITGGANDAFTFIGSAGFSGNAGELRAFNVGANTVVRADVDGDSHADFAIFMNGTFLLLASDFSL